MQINFLLVLFRLDHKPCTALLVDYQGIRRSFKTVVEDSVSFFSCSRVIMKWLFFVLFLCIFTLETFFAIKKCCFMLSYLLEVLSIIEVCSCLSRGGLNIKN